MKLGLEVVLNRRRTDLCMRTPFPLRRQKACISARSAVVALAAQSSRGEFALYPLSDSASKSDTPLRNCIQPPDVFLEI
jgi:hypothetical protein